MKNNLLWNELKKNPKNKRWLPELLQKLIFLNVLKKEKKYLEMVRSLWHWEGEECSEHSENELNNDFNTVIESISNSKAREIANTILEMFKYTPFKSQGNGVTINEVRIMKDDSPFFDGLLRLEKLSKKTKSKSKFAKSILHELRSDDLLLRDEIDKRPEESLEIVKNWILIGIEKSFVRQEIMELIEGFENV